MVKTSKIGLFVINYNGISFLSKLFINVLDTLNIFREKLYEKIDIWIIDNASADSSAKIISRYKNLKLIQLKRNVGYGSACNIAYVISKKMGYDYDLLIFMNNDIILFHEKIITFLKIISKLWKYYNGKFLATAILVNGYDNKIDYGGLFIDNIGNTWSLRTIIEDSEFIDKHARTLGLIDIHYADGAFIVIPAHIFEKLGGFSRSYFMYLEDVDLSFKAHMLNVKVVLIPIVIGVHYRSSTSGHISTFTLYHIVRNTIYLILKYFGITSLIKSLLFHMSYVISLSLKLPSSRRFNKAFSCIGLKHKLRLYALALRAVIDGIRMWMRKKERYNMPRRAYLYVPLNHLITLKSYERFVQQIILDHISSSIFSILRQKVMLDT